MMRPSILNTSDFRKKNDLKLTMYKIPEIGKTPDVFREPGRDEKSNRV